jgi:hypothetical protein
MSTGPEVCPALFARIITHLFPCPYFCLSHTSLYPDHHFPPILFISSFALSFPACLAQHISSLPQPIMSDPSEYDQVIRPPAEEHLSDALAAFGQDLTDDPVWQDSITFGLFLELHQIQPGQVQPWWHSPDEYLPSQAARLGLRRASPTQHVRLAAKSNNCRPASEDTKTRQCHRGCLPAFWYE